MKYEFWHLAILIRERIKREINNLGYEITKVDNGRVFFKGDEDYLP